MVMLPKMPNFVFVMSIGGSLRSKTYQCNDTHLYQVRGKNMFATGAKVGAQRWPHINSHPDNWETPHSGIVLDRNDPRAWKDSLRFSGTPTVEEVDEWLRKLEQMGDNSLDEVVPVLWSFGRVRWEKLVNLRTYEEDLAEWQQMKSEIE